MEDWREKYFGKPKVVKREKKDSAMWPWYFAFIAIIIIMNFICK